MAVRFRKLCSVTCGLPFLSFRILAATHIRNGAFDVISEMLFSVNLFCAARGPATSPCQRARCLSRPRWSRRNKSRVLFDIGCVTSRATAEHLFRRFTTPKLERGSRAVTCLLRLPLTCARESLVDKERQTSRTKFWRRFMQLFHCPCDARGISS